MTSPRLDIGEEVVAKKTFVWALVWPGWCRAGKDRNLAIEALLAARGRYAKVARRAGLALPEVEADDLWVVETVEGNGGTDFGVPSRISDADGKRTTAADAKRLGDLVDAAWVIFDRVADNAPPTLRKGPRGGGRDTAKVVDHVVMADHAYAREMGIRLPEPSREDRAAIEAERAAMLDVLRQASDGTPLADRRWTARYAARRVAWHALDHAWEIEDRTDEPA
jgi:hypothetical protein